jgi:hypothetical protein
MEWKRWSGKDGVEMRERNRWRGTVREEMMACKRWSVKTILILLNDFLVR